MDILEKIEWAANTIRDKLHFGREELGAALAREARAKGVLLDCSIEITNLREDLEIAHAYISNLQHGYNDCRSWFSNVEFIPETEDLEEYISLNDCDENQAAHLKTETEETAMAWFGYWFDIVKNKYNVKTLEEYEEFIGKNIEKLNKKKEKKDGTN